MTWRRAEGLTDRRSERDALDRLVAAVRGGQSRALVVRGDPGVGKTALLDYLARRASGCQVARASGVQSEMELAFAGLHQLCAPMLSRAERARRELIATGGTVRKPSVETSVQLTAQETLIARLAGDGHSNAEIATQLFLSARTVEWHLRKVFTKLGISSRLKLREALSGVPDGTGT